MFLLCWIQSLKTPPLFVVALLWLIPLVFVSPVKPAALTERLVIWFPLSVWFCSCTLACTRPPPLLTANREACCWSASKSPGFERRRGCLKAYSNQAAASNLKELLCFWCLYRAAGKDWCPRKDIQPELDPGTWSHGRHCLTCHHKVDTKNKKSVV